MSRKISVLLAALSLCFVIVVSGCGPSADLSLKFASDAVSTYKATSVVTKDFRFEQPNLNKLREEQTKSQIEMGYTQTIQDVDADGNATALITINDLKVDIVNKNEIKLAFDSQNEKDKNAPLAKLLGQSYTIQITPAGQVKALDTQTALQAVKSAYEKKIAAGMLDPKAIALRHQINALPKDQTGELSIKSTWTEIVPSPPGLLAPKSYNKTYTLTGIDSNIATVEMTGTESAEPAKGGMQPVGSMGIFAKMFDNIDDYTGLMKIDLASGQVLRLEETLVSSYIAQEMPENADPEKGPDTLTMQFTNRILLEKLD